MFCPNCGKGDQTPGVYCRTCGEYLANTSDPFYLMSKILGVSTPEKQLVVNLSINLLTALFSLLLVFFLMGFFDGQQAKTGKSAPPIIYVVYVFLALVSIWQFLSFINGVVLKSKLSGRRKGLAQPDTRGTESVGPAATTRDLLPPATSEHIAASSVTEHTTKILDKVPRQ